MTTLTKSQRLEILKNTVDYVMRHRPISQTSRFFDEVYAAFEKITLKALSEPTEK